MNELLIRLLKRRVAKQAPQFERLVDLYQPLNQKGCILEL